MPADTTKGLGLSADATVAKERSVVRRCSDRYDNVARESGDDHTLPGALGALLLGRRRTQDMRIAGATWG